MAVEHTDPQVAEHPIKKIAPEIFRGYLAGYTSAIFLFGEYPNDFWLTGKPPSLS